MTTDNYSSAVLFKRLLIASALGIVSWYAIDMLYNTIIWQITGGQVLYGRYGRDKSLANMVIEFPWAVVITFTSFLLARPRVKRKWLRRFFCALVPLLIALSLVVPGLGE